MLAATKAAVALAILAGCASGARPGDGRPEAGTDFTRMLAQEYGRLAAFDSDYLHDDDAANHFAHKGLAAADGKIVPPEELTHWHIPAADADELAAARARLVAWLEGGARATDPDRAARAQTRFDCWLQTASDPELQKLMATCRDEFRAALAPASEKAPAAPSFGTQT
jgi:OOP family OmpA-OmpF porin